MIIIHAVLRSPSSFTIVNQLFLEEICIDVCRDLGCGSRSAGKAVQHWHENLELGTDAATAIAVKVVVPEA